MANEELVKFFEQQKLEAEKQPRIRPKKQPLTERELTERFVEEHEEYIAQEKLETEGIEKNICGYCQVELTDLFCLKCRRQFLMENNKYIGWIRK